MLDKRTQNRLERLLAARKLNLGRSIYIIYRHFNEWSHKKWSDDGWKDFRPEQLRLISIISLEPVNINALSKKARVSKQAMSKMVNDLVAKGYIAYEPDPNDSRAKIISITKAGVDFMEYFLGCSGSLENQYVDLIGVRPTKQLIKILSQLAEGIIDWERKERGD